MRESNFSFPATNRAAVCITSHLYDRRALDTTSPLPLFNTLSHLTTLSSTSPRIREILVMDGGLERIVRILRDFCTNPPPPEPPSQFYGLLPPPSQTAHPRQTPTGPPNHDPKRPFDRAAAYRFSLALQCLVNIGVRGSEFIRARVVQAGTLDVIGCILEAWLTSKGILVLPSASLTGIPRESKEARHARRQAHIEIRNQEEAFLACISIPFNPRIQVEASTSRMDEDDAPSTGTSNNASPTTTPLRSTSPTDADAFSLRTRRQSAPAEAGPSAATTMRQDTEPESDADVEMEDVSASESIIVQPQPEQGPPQVDIIEPDNIDMILSGVGEVVRNNQITMDMNMNMDIDDLGTTMDRQGLAGVRDLGIAAENRERHDTAEDMTPRATFAPLPDVRTLNNQRQPPPQHPLPHPRLHNPATRNPQTFAQMPRVPPGVPISAVLPSGPRPPPPHDAGPYREEDVLLSLQLLAYLSKYPHVRQAFYKPRQVFNPVLQQTIPSTTAPSRENSSTPTDVAIFKSPSRGKERARPSTSDSVLPSSTHSSPLPLRATPSLTQSTNIFSLVERFTFRPYPAEMSMTAVHPVIPSEIQHWAGVVMRNACRKDESRGGIRQCANVQCGKWETFPREFAKCRRCRKAKYCGKECQSRAWSEGHRFWCSAKEEEGEGPEGDSSRRTEQLQINPAQTMMQQVTTPDAIPTPPEETGARRQIRAPRTIDVYRPPPTFQTVQPAQPSLDTLMQRVGIPPPTNTLFTVRTTTVQPLPTVQASRPGALGTRAPEVGLFRTGLRAVEPPAQAHAPYLHMRRIATTGGNFAPGAPNVSTADLPGQVAEHEHRSAGNPSAGPSLWTFGSSSSAPGASSHSSPGSLD